MIKMFDNISNVIEHIYSLWTENWVPLGAQPLVSCAARQDRDQSGFPYQGAWDPFHGKPRKVGGGGGKQELLVHGKSCFWELHRRVSKSHKLWGCEGEEKWTEAQVRRNARSRGFIWNPKLGWVKCETVQEEEKNKCNSTLGSPPPRRSTEVGPSFREEKMTVTHKAKVASQLPRLPARRVQGGRPTNYKRPTKRWWDKFIRKRL